MRSFKFILPLASILAVSFQVGATPTFPPLFYLGTLNINITAGQQIPVYGGTRVLNSYLGGYATNAFGKTIAHIILGEGGEGGLINSKGLFHPSVRGALRFDQEIAYAFFTMEGVKNGSEYLYVNIETNSTTYDILNKLFIIASGTKTPDNVLHFQLYSPGPGLPL